MMRPPKIAGWLVRMSCPPRDLPYVLGDLDAEYALRGGPNWWYWRQAIRSAGQLAMLGMRRADWEYSLLAVFAASAAPAVLMEGWWGFVLRHVPLKADVVRQADFAVISLALSAAVALFAGATCTRRGLRLAVPAAWMFALLGQAAAHNRVPGWFCGADMATVGLALTAGAWVRGRFDRPSGGRLA